MQTNPEYLTLRILWPTSGHFDITRPRNGDEAHKLAAKAVTLARDDPRCRVNDRLFHHAAPVDGYRVALEGLSPFRFGANAQGMHLTAAGNEAADLLADHGHRLTRAVSRMAGVVLQERWHRGFVALHASTTPRIYRVGHFVATRRPTKLSAPVAEGIRTNTLTPEVRTWVEQRIASGIVRQAALLNLPEPAIDHNVRLVSAGRFGGWRRKGVYYGIVLHDAVFASDWTLSGPWSVGALCLLGSGYLQALRMDAQLPLAA